MYEASSAEAAPSIIATANAPPRNQCLRCRVFASIFDNGTTRRAESSVRSSSKLGSEPRSGEFVALSNLFFIVSLLRAQLSGGLAYRIALQSQGHTERR